MPWSLRRRWFGANLGMSVFRIQNRIERKESYTVVSRDADSMADSYCNGK